MRTQTDRAPTSQIDDATIWNGKELEESTNEVSNGMISFEDFGDEDFKSLTLIDPFTFEEINTC